MRAWRDLAACIWADPERFFPPHSAMAEAVAEVRAALCDHCPVRLYCLADALNFEAQRGVTRDGIFGGMSPATRTELHGNNEWGFAGNGEN